MAGWSHIRILRELEAKIDELGLKFAQPRHVGGWPENQEYVALVPKGPGSVTVYSPDAEVFVGTLEQAQTWINGVIWARKYDEMLRLSDEKKRTQKEQKLHHRQEQARAKARYEAEQKQIVQILKS
jgi:hypothetical protein